MPVLGCDSSLGGKGSVRGPNAMTNRLRSIDVLRGVAAAAVMAFHYEGMLSLEWSNYWSDLKAEHFHLGLMGVELFFILSGFVILLTLEKTYDLYRFVVGRIARLYPAYIVSVLLSAAFLLSIDAATPLQAVVNITMLQKFVGFQNLISPYWTLTYELLFYAVMGIIFQLGFVNKIEYLSIIWLLAAHFTRMINIELSAWQSFASMINFGHLFIAGMMIFRLVSGHRSLVTLSALMLAVSYSSFGRNDWAQIPPATYFCVNAAFIAIVWWAAAASARQSTCLVSIGELSYSLYLLHVPVCLMLIWSADLLLLWRSFAISLAVPVSFGLAYLSRRFIEIPGRIYIAEVVFGGLRHAWASIERGKDNQ
ncbi:peptidoglycan/LPS O-acetylase OafA/YrhL [Bradyrhizobium sp. LB8.2]|uniref:acyltransferase family protein n=1 Tax=unclassified Bradyrhizobium TaxID=2631580 RepID=UPI003397807B